MGRFAGQRGGRGPGLSAAAPATRTPQFGREDAVDGNAGHVAAIRYRLYGEDRGGVAAQHRRPGPPDDSIPDEHCVVVGTGCERRLPGTES